jgi:hypothetical protein
MRPPVLVDGAASTWSELATTNTSELRFSALLAEGGAERLELMRA